MQPSHTHEHLGRSPDTQRFTLSIEGVSLGSANKALATALEELRNQQIDLEDRTVLVGNVVASGHRPYGICPAMMRTDFEPLQNLLAHQHGER